MSRAHRGVNSILRPATPLAAWRGLAPPCREQLTQDTTDFWFPSPLSRGKIDRGRFPRLQEPEMRLLFRFSAIAVLLCAANAIPAADPLPEDWAFKSFTRPAVPEVPNATPR